MIEIQRRNPAHRFAREVYFAITVPITRLYYFLVRPQTRGVKAIVTFGGKFLLVQVGYGQKKWSFPGGMVDRNETFKDAAIRELEEETGVVVTEMIFLDSLFQIYEHKRDTVQCFTAVSPTDSLRIDDQEIIRAGWFARNEFPEDTSSFVQKGLKMYDTYIAQHG
jgi:ADP-ribose pyrophosphatase YjhB (NUDIX family)